MCKQIIEVYAGCKCLYYENGIDQCVNYGRKGHKIQRITQVVGQNCELHSKKKKDKNQGRSDEGESSYSYTNTGYDSGYSTFR